MTMSRDTQVTLVKQLPGMSNLPALEVQSTVVLWWKRVFEGDEAIDVEAISDRPAAANRAANANVSDARQIPAQSPRPDV